jgi:chorismate synthase
VVRIAFKPTSTIARKQNTVSRAGEEIELLARGRHDPCVVPRAVPMVEAMAALVIADQLLQVNCLRHALYLAGKSSRLCYLL